MPRAKEKLHLPTTTADQSSSLSGTTTFSGMGSIEMTCGTSCFGITLGRLAVCPMTAPLFNAEATGTVSLGNRGRLLGSLELAMPVAITGRIC